MCKCILVWGLLLVSWVGVVHGQDPTRPDSLIELSLYNGESIKEFLRVCRYPNNIQVNDESFESYYRFYIAPGSGPAYDVRCRVLELGTHDGMNSEEQKQHMKERFDDLRDAQRTVDKGRRLLKNHDYFPLVMILLVIVGCGIYLIVLGHYQFQTLYDKYHPDPASGTPCWQYIRLKYVAAKVKGQVKDKSLLVPIEDAPLRKKKNQLNKNETNATVTEEAAAAAADAYRKLD